MRLNTLMGSFLCTKNEKKYFEENKFKESFCEFQFFYIKRPIDVEFHMYKVNNYVGM